MHLHHIEVQAARDLAESAAQRLASLRLDGDRDGVVTWWMFGERVMCQIRRSRTNGIWFNATSAMSSYDCVMMNGRRMPGRLVSARYDSEVFIEWLIEEIEESAIRHKILAREAASNHGSLKGFIKNEYNRLLEDAANPLAVTWS